MNKISRMKDSKSYGQFCPVARAAEIVGARWTLVLLRELLAGSIKFNHLRNGLPRMSPSLLSKRLIELEDVGIVRKQKSTTGKGHDYVITGLGKELAPVVMMLGTWGQKYIIKELAKHELDPGLLMWDIRRRIDASRFPETSRFVTEFHLSDAPSTRRTWWVVFEGGEVDLCVQSPGRRVDLCVEAEVKVLTKVWMGTLSIDEAKRKKLLVLKGSDKYIRSFDKWFSLSVFAKVAQVLPRSRNERSRSRSHAAL